MPATTLHLQHAELCSCCNDLLPTGTSVIVATNGDATCLSCAGEPTGLRHSDPWAPIESSYLRHRLAHRATGYRHPVSIPA